MMNAKCAKGVNESVEKEDKSRRGGNETRTRRKTEGQKLSK